MSDLGFNVALTFNEKEISSLKFKNPKFWKAEKIVWRYGDSYLSTKFGVNLIDCFWENVFYGRTDDGRLRHGISSADYAKQS